MKQGVRGTSGEREWVTWGLDGRGRGGEVGDGGGGIRRGEGE